MRALTGLVLLSLTAALILAACGSGDDDTATSKVTPTPRDATAIRTVDVADVPAVSTTARQLGGEVDEKAVMYVDLTGDGREEAVVPIASGGTLGNLAYVVLTVHNGTPESILTETAAGTAGGVQMELDVGKLVATTAEYGPEDPLCCPSYLIKTQYRWDGTQLQVETENRLPNPNAQTKE
jgi:hypothetical protein